MVPLSDGRLEYDAHVWSVLGNLNCSRHLFTSKNLKGPAMPYMCRTCSELPSCLNTMFATELLRDNRNINTAQNQRDMTDMM